MLVLAGKMPETYRDEGVKVEKTDHERFNRRTYSARIEELTHQGFSKKRKKEVGRPRLH